MNVKEALSSEFRIHTIEFAQEGIRYRCSIEVLELGEEEVLALILRKRGQAGKQRKIRYDEITEVNGVSS